MIMNSCHDWDGQANRCVRQSLLRGNSSLLRLPSEVPARRHSQGPSHNNRGANRQRTLPERPLLSHQGRRVCRWLCVRLPLVELESRESDVRQPFLRILLQTSAQQPAKLRWRVGRDDIPSRLSLENRGDKVGNCFPALERSPARSISKSTQPKDQMSVRRSTGFPRACSGLMYAAGSDLVRTEPGARGEGHQQNSWNELILPARPASGA
jgi:hypothetical protein